MTRLGVDLGGTWLRLCRWEEGRPLVFASAPAVVPADLAGLLRRSPLARGVSLLRVGARGVWGPRQRRSLAGSLRSLAGKVEVFSDLELARAAAFGSGPGVIVIGGTGSAALGADARGRMARAGGLGPLLGDEGSAFWIAKRALAVPSLRRALGSPDLLALVHVPNPVAAIAALAPRVLELARKRHRAKRIVDEAGRALADMGLAAGIQLGLRGRIPLSWRGGLFEDAGFLAAFLRRVGPRCDPRPPLMAAEAAAAVLPDVLQWRAQP